MFDHVSGPYRYVSSYRGAPVRPFYYYLCHGYTGAWPSQRNNNF
jgi:hypothetical protein